MTALIASRQHIINLNYPTHNHSKPPPRINSWTEFTGLTINFLKQLKTDNVHNIDHSLDTMTLIITTINTPELFHDLILIKPILLPPPYLKLTTLLQHFGLSNPLSPTRLTQKQRKTFPSRKTILRSLTAKELFQHVRRDILKNYITYGSTNTNKNTIHLLYPRKIKTQIFDTIYPNS